MFLFYIVSENLSDPCGGKNLSKTNGCYIYIYHEAFGQRYPEYKIDLKNKKFWEFTSDGYENYIARDSSVENEGFTFVCSLDDDKIETFILDSSRYGFTKWKKSYRNNKILDGHQWGITIVFRFHKKRNNR